MEDVSNQRWRAYEYPDGSREQVHSPLLLEACEDGWQGVTTERAVHWFRPGWSTLRVMDKEGNLTETKNPIGA